VLELAGGTGMWTQQLVRWADRLTVVDAAPETLALNRARVSGAGIPIDYVETDLFAWRPPRRYDVVFFSFWLTHVPPTRFEEFWSLVADCLEPGGRFLVIDNARPFEDLGEDFPKLWVEEGRIRTPWSNTDVGAGVSERRLSDGRTFNVVKLFYEPSDLEARLADLGWTSTFAATDTFFLYGSGARS
jgi:demethylmenaquinone methyltransferase/2-methoxy-6-polyprenyl-1,4-benzoquinol methylase